ncbi:hypothetical protein PENTCL1PPCAC_30034, partial [Pristionchus entomophagus]
STMSSTPTSDKTPCLTLTPEEFLCKLSQKSWYLHIILVICSLSWTVNCLTVMVSAFYDHVEPNSTFVSLSQEFIQDPSLSFLRELTSSSFMIGNIIGGLTIAPLSDKVGRHPILLLCSCGQALSLLVLSIAPDVYSFIGLRALQGMFYTGNGQAAWILAFESCPVSLRASAAFVFGMSWVAGYVVLLPIVIFAPSWRYIMFLSAIPCVLFAAAVLIENGFRFVPESLQFLVMKGRNEQSQKWTRRFVDGPTLISMEDTHDDGKSSTKTDSFQKNKKIIFCIVLVGGLWICDSFDYFGLAFYSTKLAGNIYVNYAILGLIEAPAYMVTHRLLNTLPRRHVMSLSLNVAGIAFMILSILDEGSAPSIICWTVGKLAISIVYLGVYVVGSEVFPTNVRNSALGICSVISRLGGVLAPYIVTLDRINRLLPIFVFAGVAFTGALFACLLPEIKDHEPTRKVAD